MQVPAERGFNRGGKFWIDIELGHERAEDRGLKSFRIVETFQNGLRTLREAFALLVQLLEHIEARFFFGQRSLERDQFLFRAVEHLAMLFQSLLGFARPGQKNVDVFFLFLGNRARGGKFLFNFVAGRARFGNRCVEVLQMFAGRFPANRDAGQFIFESANPLLAFRQRHLQLLQFGLVRRPFRAKLRKLVGKLFQFRFFCLKQSLRSFR